jgi:uncharacterized protein (DUF1015 family)
LVDIKPFKAIRYTSKAGDAADLITQPYDKIDAAMQKAYYEKSPYNYCRVILPMEPNKYEIANERISHWLKENVMAKESEPALYISRQEFTLNGKHHARTGMIVALRLHPYHENIVFPHEATYKAPKADRLNMVRTVQKDLEPLFLMYQDPENATIKFFAEVAKTPPTIQVTDSLGIRHTLWKISDPQQVQLLQNILAPKNIVLCDGHHRYESSIAYRDEMRSKGDWTANSAFNFHMSYIVPVQEKDLIVLPTHRLLRDYKLTPEILAGIKNFFEVTELAPNVEAIETFLADHRSEHAFGLYDGKNAYGLQLKHNPDVYQFVNANVSKETKIFDVVILRDIVFKQVLKTGQLNIDETILYERWAKDAVDRVNRCEAGVAFLLNPIPAKTVAEIAVKHELLPEKSTDFYPKMVSGLLMMDIAADETL